MLFVSCDGALQINVLLLHEDHSHMTARTLLTAANLLCPQTVRLPLQSAQQVLPAVHQSAGPLSSEGVPQKVVYASALNMANAGSAVQSNLLVKADTAFIEA